MELVVREYKPPLWKLGLIVLGGLTVVGLVLLWQIDDPVWGNALRLATFIFFAGATVCGLKTMEGSYTVRLAREEGMVRMTFFRNSRELEEESFELSSLSNLQEDHLQKGLRGLYLWDEVYLTGRFPASEERMHLFHFGGRPLPFDPETAGRIRVFLQSEAGRHQHRASQSSP